MERKQQQGRKPCDQSSVPIASIDVNNVTTTTTNNEHNNCNKFPLVVDNQHSEESARTTYCSHVSSHPHNHPSINAHFPNILHRLLTTTNKDGDDDDDHMVTSAMEWLPHGRGWRVLRWDVLRTKVLPRLFPSASTTRENGKNKGIIDNNDKNYITHDNNNNNVNNYITSYPDIGHQPLISREDDIGDKDKRMVSSFIDHDSYEDDEEQQEWLVEIFLYHIRAFGFVEVTSGLNRGSYYHEVRTMLCHVSLLSFFKPTS